MDITLNTILPFIITLIIVIFIDFIITPLLKPKSKKKNKYLNILLTLLYIFIPLFIFEFLFIQKFYLNNSLINLSYSTFNSIDWAITVIPAFYALILLLYSAYLFISKKPNAKNILQKGIIWFMIASLLIALLELFSMLITIQ